MSETKEFKYEVNGKTYVQRPLVLGQLKQVIKPLAGLDFSEEMDALTVVKTLGDRLPEILAVALTMKGKSPKDKDVEALAREFAEHMDLATAVSAVDDFFGCNPVALILQRVMGMFRETLAQAAKKKSAGAEKKEAGTGSKGKTG